MADFPLFPFTSQEDWYGELTIQSADAGNAPVSLVGRTFEMPITVAQQGNAAPDPVQTLTMTAGGGLSFKTDGTDGTLVFRVARSTARQWARADYTADLLEVVQGERHLFLPVRIRYSDPAGFLAYASRILSAAFSARQQPIITPLAIAGRQGVAGATILTGSAPPAPADGKDGDYWIEDRTASSLGRRMYGPKAAGAWPGTPWIIQVAGIADVPGLSSALASKATPTDIDAAIAALKNGADAAHDTLKEIQDLLTADEGTLAAALTAIGNRLVATSNLADVADRAAALANLNGLDRRILSLSANPGTGDIPSGTVRVAKNTTTGRLSLWANDGGTMVDLLTFTPS